MAASELPGLQLALKGRSTYVSQCLLIGHDRTCRERALTAEFDPIRTCRDFSGSGTVLTGAQLVLGACDISKDKSERFVTVVTAHLPSGTSESPSL